MELYKYPRTYHLPFSGGIQSDDKIIGSLDSLENEEVVVLHKLDGECTSLYRRDMHARSIDSRHNHTRDWVKRLHEMIKYMIGEDERLCGENLWAEHSIRYADFRLNGYFYLFSVWFKNICYSWDDTLEYASLPFDLRKAPYFSEGMQSKEGAAFPF